MKCPVDGTALLITERSGVEIDYCPQCRGVWLDRGELDKIIDRSVSTPPAAAPEPSRQAPGYDRYDDRRSSQQYAPQQQGSYKKRKKESWLSEIFD